MGGKTFGQALKGPGRPAARPLLPGAARPLAVAAVGVCVLVTAVLAAWLRHGLEAGWLDTAINTYVQASLDGHRLLLAVLVWPGAPLPAAAMIAALVLACLVRRQYAGAALVAISVPLAAALTELVLKPVIGRTSWGTPFPSGHVTSVAALVTALTVLLIRTPAKMPRPLCMTVAFAASLVTAATAVGVIGAHMHHFPDTVAGAAVGTGTVLATALVLDRLTRAHAQPPAEVQGAGSRTGQTARSGGG